MLRGASPAVAICDSSPLIHYSRIGRLEILGRIFAEVLVPPAVWDEVALSGGQYPDIHSITNASWIRRQPLADAERANSLREVLHRGESEAIALAEEYAGAIPLILDDRRARRIAEGRGLQFNGSIGLLLVAKQRGIVREIAPVLTALVDSGLFVSERLIGRVLAEANELPR